MQQQITKGFDYFLKQNELGKTDSKNMNRLLQIIYTTPFSFDCLTRLTQKTNSNISS